MPDLSFRVENAEPVTFAAAPLLAFKLRVSNGITDEPIQSIALCCQIQIEASRRRYSPEEQRPLVDLFGEPDRWNQTVRNRLWTHASVVVPPFRVSTVVDLHVPCTFDFSVAATKYFHALQDGEIPLSVLPSGTVFFAAPDGALQVAQIPWDRETKFRLPVKVWHQMMDHYYPNSAWLCLRRDVFERLHQYKIRQGLPTWEQTLENILSQIEETVH